MGKQRSRRRAAATAPAPAAVAPADAPASGWRAFVLGNAVGLAVSPFIRFVAAFPLGFAIVLLSTGWLVGPARLLDAWRFRTYTASANGRIVDSWLAIDFDAAAQADHGNWAGPARATHCAVVAYDGEWGEPTQRAFCGNRINVHGEEMLPLLVDDATMAPGVPFAMPRDERGFAVPHVRIGAAESAWLKAHPPFSGFDARASRTAWDALRLRLDRPLDAAIAGWAAAPPAFPLAFDPRDPGAAMPAAYVAARRDPGNGGASLLGLLPLAGGVWLWLRGMALLMGGVPALAMRFAAAVPLLLLPWWGERMPRALARVQPQVAEIVGDMLADIDVTGRLVASSPDAAQLAHGGERLAWRVGEGVYADTLGRIAWGPPPPPAGADAAVQALASRVSLHVAALPTAQRARLFERLADDKEAGRYGAGALFLPVAAESAYAADRPDDERRAAERFLDVWITQPVDEPSPYEAGYAGRVDLLRRLVDVPEVTIANRARWIVERAQAPPR
ncbi:MAG TPA: hypothetical protein VFS55_06835 [Dokdonella sp.]|nr:hypothetical protein [Dokdonella sp.]